MNALHLLILWFFLSLIDILLLLALLLVLVWPRVRCLAGRWNPIWRRFCRWSAGRLAWLAGFLQRRQATPIPGVFRWRSAFRWNVPPGR
jgi:hypothetical protein